MTDTKHTPTPWDWRHREDGIPGLAIFAKDSAIALACTANIKTHHPIANAAFIVRACNAHEDLVGLLKEAQTYVGFVAQTSTAETNRVNGRELLVRMAATLAKAEAGR